MTGIQRLWTIADNGEYDKEMWDLLFEEEGIASEESFDESELEDLED